MTSDIELLTLVQRLVKVVQRLNDVIAFLMLNLPVEKRAEFLLFMKDKGHG